MSELGASNQTVQMTASFLEDRYMRIKVPGLYRSLHRMPGGAPQGTKCGNLLFCIAVSALDDETVGSSPLQVEPPVSNAGNPGNLSPPLRPLP